MRAAERHGVDQLFLFATSAIRDATNRDHIVDLMEQRVGVRPEFLAGEDEALLTYSAAHRWYGWSTGRLLLLDIGGGSLEIALGRDAEPDLMLSLPLGAGRLTRVLLHDDPPSPGQVKKLRRHVRSMLSEVADRVRWEGTPDRAVGTSKTFKQLARLGGAPSQRKGPFVPRTLTIDARKTWIPRLAGMRAAERARLRGVSAPRAQQIRVLPARARVQACALQPAEQAASGGDPARRRARARGRRAQQRREARDPDRPGRAERGTGGTRDRRADRRRSREGPAGRGCAARRPALRHRLDRSARHPSELRADARLRHAADRRLELPVHPVPAGVRQGPRGADRHRRQHDRDAVPDRSQSGRRGEGHPTCAAADGAAQGKPGRGGRRSRRTSPAGGRWWSTRRCSTPIR